MSYTRQQKEDAIQLLAELYPKCFFVDTGQRRPLKHNIVADLINDGVELGHELVRHSVDWYESSFGYQHALQAGIKRIDLQGKLGTAVTEQEQRNAQKYFEERKQEERERKLERNNVVVEKISRLPITKVPALSPMMIVQEQLKETPMPVKAVRPNDPLTQLSELTETVRTMPTQPKPLRPFPIAGLRVVIAEIESVIATMEKTNG